jgi:YD repeat-containing protein
VDVEGSNPFTRSSNRRCPDRTAAVLFLAVGESGGGGAGAREAPDVHRFFRMWLSKVARRNTIRRTGVTLPGSLAVSYVYDTGTNGAYDSEASRLSKMTVSSVSVARYKYLGFGNVVATEYDEADVYQRRHGTTAGTYPDLDQFGRVIKSRWTKDLTTDMDFVSVDVSYDENSNPLTTEDNIYAAGFDVKYAIDGLDRVTDADEGTLSGGNITSQTRRQQWTLTQTGNWDAETLDLNGATAGYGTDGRTETRTHNLVNELTARSVTTDSGGPTAKTLAYDAAGNLTDDGETYAYEYDAWHRLRKIKDRGTSAVLSEHQYYGNGFRAGERYDANDDAVIDGTDPWYWFGYDERWRIVGTFIGSDASPKERFLHHTAGAGGYGTSSYIDQVVLRERDANTAWHLSSDGTLEERLYYCQNWRHDVVALVTANGQLRERIRYSSYGIPFGQPLGDCDGDGDVDAADSAILLGAWGTNSPKCDLDLNGTIDATDQSILLGNSGATSGFGELTRNRNRLGYAGYVADGESAEVRWHVRHRVLESKLGRWTRRDPLGYAEYCAKAGRTSPAA